MIATPRHEPVMPAETIALLEPSRGGLFVDCTTGLGGHAALLLEHGATRLIGLDRDPDALAIAAERLRPFGDRVELVHADYRQLGRVLDERRVVPARRGAGARRVNPAHLRRSLEDGLVSAGGLVIAADAPRIATIGSYRMPGVPAAAQMMQFDLAGISVSAGSACSSGSLKTSHVLTAMGMDEEAAREVIRVSFGPRTSDGDVARFLAEWKSLFDRRKAA